MTDYISRDDALNFEMEIEADPEEIQAISKGMALYGEYIKSIPAAEVVEKMPTAVWKPRNMQSAKLLELVANGDYYGYTGDGFEFECSRCGHIFRGNAFLLANYCPNCGAWMKARESDGN